jgi:hypothetical protein
MHREYSLNFRSGSEEYSRTNTCRRRANFCASAARLAWPFHNGCDRSIGARARLLEDKAIIEAQQKVFDADPNHQLLAIAADAALTYFRWALARRIEAERNAARAA